MRCAGCKWKCTFAFGSGLIIASFFESGFGLFMFGAAVIVLSFALKSCCC